MYASSNWVIIGAVSGVSPVQHQANTSASSDLLLIGVNHLKQQTQNTGHGKALFPGKRVQQQEIYHIACHKQNVG